MNFAEQLRILQAAQGDPAKLALATVDLKYPELPEAERATLKEVLEAAAIPHWCDAAILAALLGIPLEESAARLAQLRGLTVVEPFKARGETAVNVHEAARLVLRKRMARKDQQRFQKLSAQAAKVFEQVHAPAKRIEWIYHRLCAESERGATELEALNRQWSGSARPEDYYALAAALKELDDSQMVAGRARAWSLLVIAWARHSHGEVAQLETAAREVLLLARETNDQSAGGDAQALIGDVLEAQGKLAEAQVAFGEYLTISRRLAEQDPSNAGWQRDLAVAHSKMGGVLQAQGKLAEAQAAFGETLKISRRLAEQDPSNAGWQRGLAVAHSRVGDVLQAQGKLAEATKPYCDALTVIKKLTAADPHNADWQRDLALANWRLASLDFRADRYAAALPLYDEAARIFGELAVKAPGFAQWAKDKQQVEAQLASCRLMLQLAKSPGSTAPEGPSPASGVTP